MKLKINLISFLLFITSKMHCPTLDEQLTHTIHHAVQKSIESHSERLPHYYPSAFHDSGIQYELMHYVGAMKPEELSLTEHDGVLHIDGKSHVEYKNGSSCDYQFSQRVPLPPQSNMKLMTSYLKNGHVVVVVPKSEKK